MTRTSTVRVVAMACAAGCSCDNRKAGSIHAGYRRIAPVENQHVRSYRRPPKLGQARLCRHNRLRSVSAAGESERSAVTSSQVTCSGAAGRMLLLTKDFAGDNKPAGSAGGLDASVFVLASCAAAGVATTLLNGTVAAKTRKHIPHRTSSATSDDDGNGFLWGFATFLSFVPLANWMVIL